LITFRQSEESDIDYIKSVLVDDDEMWERSSDDYSIRNDDFIKNRDVMWLIAMKGDISLGVLSINAASNVVLNIHIHIPKQHRSLNSNAIGVNGLRWIKDNSIEKFKKINTKIPVIYKDVIRFAHSIGFKDEGIDRLSVMKNGKLIDRLNLGITFGEIA
jgi:hypothetical protein